jgi:hypothetical protein
VEARASYFAARPIQVNVAVADVLAFLLREPPATGGLPYPADLGQETYLQVESIRGLLTTQPLHQCFGEVYGTFVARTMNLSTIDDFRQIRAERKAAHCMEDPITDTYPAVAHCLAELKRLNTTYAELSEPDPTEAGQRARAAGAEALLGIFSHYNVAKAMAQQRGISIAEAYQMAWEDVATILVHDRRTAILSENIQKNSQRHE